MQDRRSHEVSSPTLRNPNVTFTPHLLCAQVERSVDRRSLQKKIVPWIAAWQDVRTITHMEKPRGEENPNRSSYSIAVSGGTERAIERSQMRCTR